MKGPLPHVQIMPTGGINASNMKEWLDAGAVAVGVGSDLNKAYKAGGYEAVVEASKKYVEAAKSKGDFQYEYNVSLVWKR